MGSSICRRLAYSIKLAIVASLLLPLAYGLSCDNVKDKELCNEIMLSDASEEEKQQLIADLSYTDVNYANHDFIYGWNTNIDFDLAPEDVTTKSSGYIKDAWLEIIAVMPSVISENKILTSGIGEVSSAYNYRVEIPSGTESGDCKTEFSLVSNDKWLNIYLNNKLIGTSTLTDFTGSDILDFKAALRIKTITKVKHYETYKYCCRYGEDGRCIKYCKKCKYEDTEYRTDEVNLEDSKRAYHYWPLIKPKIKAVDSYQDTIVGILNISNFDAFSLNFEDSSFKQFNYNYDIDVSLKPYNVFTLRANKFIKKEAKNLVVEQSNSSYKFYVSDADNCKIRFYDHFHSWEQDCDLDYNFPLIKVDTDKLQYAEDETISVVLEPKDTLINVKYGDEEVLAKNNAQFKASPNNNKITAYLGSREAQKVIHVKRKDTWDFALNLGVFSGILYSYFLLLKKYWGVLM